MIRMLDDLDSCLRAGGLDFVEVGYTAIDPTHAKGWRDRTRPASTGSFDPIGVLNHHTADPGATVANNLAVILKGNSEAPGPICQLYISREPRLYLVAAGRANHAGRGSLGATPCGDMNARLVGIEVSNDGVGERWGDAQVELYLAVDAALCKWYTWNADDIWLHHSTGPQCGNYKIDPAGPAAVFPDITVGGSAGSWPLDRWRQLVAQRLDVHPPDPPHPHEPSPPALPHGDDTVAIRHPFVRLTGRNATWHSNGVTRSWVQTPLNLRQQLFEAGIIDDNGYNALTDEQLRVAPYVTDVGDLGGYGAIVGPDPGDV